MRFTLSDAPVDVIACHCETCRRWSGYLWGALRVPRHDISITGDTLRWWHASAAASRGFCTDCGSSLFFDKQEASYIGVAPGALDDSTGLMTTAHICIAEAGDYEAIAADVPQAAGPDTPRGNKR
ncbi:GFA family protein [Salinisphaera sp. Q1T1-3]|uniref:GFA family protein n=1 Tax=Salinisphaera sp. Q1T1-3 TaxID=2321229 RepID=UPI001313DF65|nr:GFA family protein [Salinisphaera sp. Q1T1-3]